MKVRIEYEDGRYWMEAYTLKHEKVGLASMEISRFEWLRYRAYRALNRSIQRRLQNLDNEQFEKEHPAVNNIYEFTQNKGEG